MHIFRANYISYALEYISHPLREINADNIISRGASYRWDVDILI